MLQAGCSESFQVLRRGCVPNLVTGRSEAARPGMLSETPVFCAPIRVHTSNSRLARTCASPQAATSTGSPLEKVEGPEQQLWLGQCLDSHALFTLPHGSLPREGAWGTEYQV